ncbi:hypothetical protein MPC1_5840002 [Methylocella tundrae]|nr:hypothetical protein MPC1_5840002 [Methylocella tundrae]
MMPRASGRFVFKSTMTSRPLPSPSRMSITAKAGGLWAIASRPSATDPAVLTTKPRLSMLRVRRARKGLSSSTIRRERSCPMAASSGASSLKLPPWIATGGSVFISTYLNQSLVQSLTPPIRKTLLIHAATKRRHTSLI